MNFTNSYIPTPPPRTKALRFKRLRLLVTAIMIIGLGTAAFFMLRDEQPADNQAVENTSHQPQAPEPAPEAEPVLPDMQPTIDQWAASHPGTYSITIMDRSGQVKAEINSQEQYFAASIYKLYVAYIGYQRVDDGTYSLSEPYWNGWTRGKCLDEMIRTSHSPCAEKMWVELGKENITAQLKGYGLTNTSMTGLVTSSHDAAVILSRLERGLDLSEASRSKMLDSMLNQIYRDALPAGFASSQVFDKVGFRETVEYHDTAIVRFTNGQSLIVSVLTKSAGSRNIAGLAAEIEALMAQTAL